ncbi:hypothetical protein XNC3_2610019 [Xenorhabdus nematophila F1]|nr:hypothetical protein XNC3_2610019 [Xenorhabdus nematophila F1]
MMTAFTLLLCFIVFSYLCNELWGNMQGNKMSFPLSHELKLIINQ